MDFLNNGLESVSSVQLRNCSFSSLPYWVVLVAQKVVSDIMVNDKYND